MPNTALQAALRIAFLMLLSTGTLCMCDFPRPDPLSTKGQRGRSVCCPNRPAICQKDVLHCKLCDPRQIS
eukprot:scaffold3043_cov360-Prasinococcus_capsulatus_cf.AAC.3